MKIGDKICDRWIIVEEKDSGGQGKIYKVFEDGNEDNEYALKFLNKQKDTDRRLRMNREVTNVNKLMNPHLLQIVDSNTDLFQNIDVKLYYVAPYIEGVTLEKYVEDNEVSYEDAVTFFSSFLDVISYCHKQMIIHRDIKPDNVLLKKGVLNDFVLIDFGLSFNKEENEKGTATNQQLGNRFLILPELVSDDVDQKRLFQSDLAQASGLFFYVLTGIAPQCLIDGMGQPPHRREKGFQIIRDKIRDNVVFENTLLLFDKAFCVNVDERYMSAEEIINDISKLSDKRVNRYGGQIMESNVGEIEVLAPNGMNGVVRYSELIRELNPSLEAGNPAGLSLPSMTNFNELICYGVALPKPVQAKAVRYYNEGDFATAASGIWQKAENLLKRRILSLGEEFVADMVETDNLDYVRELPTHRAIELAYELGFIDKAGKKKLLRANEMYNYFKNDEADEYEEMPQDEANIIIKTSISYILYNNDESFGLQFNDFREKLKTSRIDSLYEDDKEMFATCPYFFLKTTVRSLLKLFKDTSEIEYDNVIANMNYVIPNIWGRLKLEERRAFAGLYADLLNTDRKRADVLYKVLLKVNGFDYVTENVRSRTYIQIAHKLVDVHFKENNFYNEPAVIKDLENLGTVIPSLALKDCVTAILFVKLGNWYNTCWAAEEIADRLLSRLTEDEWIKYLDNYFPEEQTLTESIDEYSSMRKKWREVVKKYSLNKLSLINPRAKTLVHIV